MREVMEVFPAKLRKLWSAWQLRALVLLSLFLQIVLLSTGSRRKYIGKKWLAAIIWLCYLSADTVATIALGVLSQAAGGVDDDDKKASSVDHSYEIMAFWAPFLLMHLGGPDTITAYSLADNELWLRHLFGLVTQVGVAVYVFLMSWTGAGTPVNYLWMVIFVAGLIKYGERTWALFSASKGQFHKFVSHAMEEDDSPGHSVQEAGEGVKDGMQVLQEAYYLFGISKSLFADLSSAPGDMPTVDYFTGSNMTWDKAFSLVEIELGLVQDLFFTKAAFVIYSRLGFFLRALSCSSTVAASIAFLLIDKNVYPKTEVTITYVLLVGAISIEIYAVVIILASDRMMTWLTEVLQSQPNWRRRMKDLAISILCKIVPWFRYLHIVPATKRWSNAMGQYSVLDSCFEIQSERLINAHQFLMQHLYWKSVSIPKGLKQFVFQELRKRRQSAGVFEFLDGFPDLPYYRSDLTLFKNAYSEREPPKEMMKIDGSVLLWHVATDLCYYADVDEAHKPDETWVTEFIPDDESSREDGLKFKREICRSISNYMMHTFIMSPFTLLSGVGQIGFDACCVDAIRFFKQEHKLGKRDACMKLIHDEDLGGVPAFAGGLAKYLQSLEEDPDLKWSRIIQAWVDILIVVAGQMKWYDHAEKLSQGGDLLTHVWLLMTHFGARFSEAALSGSQERAE